MQWIKDWGCDPGLLGSWDWAKENWTKYTVKEVEQIRRTMETFFKSFTKMELYDGSMKYRIQLTPVLTPKDLLSFHLFKERNYWREIDHPELGTKITYPGGFVKPGIGNCGVRFRAPLIGEHNEAIYTGDLKMSKEELVKLKERRVI